MNWMPRAVILSIMILMNGLTTPTSASAAGQAAPYTEEAMKKLEKVFREFKKQEPNKDVAPLEKQKASLEYFRKAFKRAGYDWDATIRAVAHDLKNKSNEIPKKGENVAMMMVALMSYMKSHCEYDHVNCLDLFCYETSEAVKWLWTNTKFAP